MPIVKSIAIHESPRRLVEYILDAKKNKDLKYATGICCHKEPEYAYRDLRDFYTLWSNKQFCNTAISGKKEDVLLIHYMHLSTKTGQVFQKIRLDFDGMILCRPPSLTEP